MFALDRHKPSPNRRSTDGVQVHSGRGSRLQNPPLVPTTSIIDNLCAEEPSISPQVMDVRP